MLDNPIIRGEFDRITNSAKKLVSWELVATLVVDDVEIYTFPNVSGERFTANFMSDMAPYHFLVINAGISVYRDYIYPNINKLRIRLQRRSQGIENPGEIYDIKSTDYIAFVTDAQDLHKTTQQRMKQSKDEQDFENFVPITFQLIEPNLYLTMNREVSGVHEGTIQDALFTELTVELKENQNTESLAGEYYTGLRGLVKDDFDNQRHYDNIIIKTGTRLNTLTNYLQNKYGISSFGIGTFYMFGFWYVYPLFKHNRFDKKNRTLTIYDIPLQELPTIENSFIKNDNKLFILSTGKSRNENSSVKTEVNDGNGIRIVPIDEYDNGFFEADGNRVKTGASEKAREFIGKEAGHRVYNVRYHERKFTANPFPEISKLKAAQGGLYTVTWMNGDYREIYPGMPGKIFYERDGEVVSVEGTLVAVNALTTTPTSDIADRSFRQVLELTFHYREE
ncbi:hypothetical protein SM033_00251 [Vibrio phage vB_VpaM_sm033]|nr:hypothetical protein SM033_00251 [Vibrio phage vB_VpaM_sm033]